jgi:hypothetical protein
VKHSATASIPLRVVFGAVIFLLDQGQDASQEVSQEVDDSMAVGIHVWTATTTLD